MINDLTHEEESKAEAQLLDWVATTEEKKLLPFSKEASPCQEVTQIILNKGRNINYQSTQNNINEFKFPSSTLTS